MPRYRIRSIRLLGRLSKVLSFCDASREYRERDYSDLEIDDLQRDITFVLKFKSEHGCFMHFSKNSNIENDLHAYSVGIFRSVDSIRRIILR